jgi:hypothetical protein
MTGKQGTTSEIEVKAGHYSPTPRPAPAHPPGSQPPVRSNASSRLRRTRPGLLPSVRSDTLARFGALARPPAPAHPPGLPTPCAPTPTPRIPIPPTPGSRRAAD